MPKLTAFTLMLYLLLILWDLLAWVVSGSPIAAATAGVIFMLGLALVVFDHRSYER
jgi:hypothetical protein